MQKKIAEYYLTITGSQKTYYNQRRIITFAPISLEKGYVHPYMRDMIQAKSITPTFNNDKLYYTPCFIIPSLQTNIEACLKKHQEKITQYAQIDKQQILIPKPRDKQYCHVCHQKFKDYYQHANYKYHQRQQKNHKFQKRIRKLCSNFQKKNGIKTKQRTQNDEIESEQSAFHLSSKQNMCLNDCSKINT